MNNDRWADIQIAALLAIGVNPLDAQRTTSWTLATMPVGADPSLWIPSAEDVSGPVDKAAIHDARVGWFAEKPTRVKRLLDSRGIND